MVQHFIISNVPITTIRVRDREVKIENRVGFASGMSGMYSISGSGTLVFTVLV